MVKADDGIVESGDDYMLSDSDSNFSETFMDIGEHKNKNSNFEIIKKSLAVKNDGIINASKALSDSDGNFSDTCRPGFQNFHKSGENHERRGPFESGSVGRDDTPVRHKFLKSGLVKDVQECSTSNYSETYVEFMEKTS